MMVMWLPIFSASSRSWLTKMMVFFSSACSCSNSSCSLVRISGSSAENGSSINRIGASVAKARARPTRCCMPPDSSCAYFFDHWSRLTSLSWRCTRSLRSASGTPASSRPRPTFSSTVRHGSRPNCWNTIATCFWRSRRKVAWSQVTTSTVLSPSLTSTWPRDTTFSRLTARSNVDLPEPDRPISTEISPSLHGQAGAGAAQHIAGLLEDLRAGGAGVDHRQRSGLVGAEDDIDVLEIDGDGHFLPPTAMRVIAVEHDGEHDDGQARLKPEVDAARAERPVDFSAEAAGADQRREHHHRQRQHDALGETRHDGGQRRGQFHLPQQLASWWRRTPRRPR